MIHNDCVEEVRSWPANQVDLIVTSIPFANHYEYTPSFNDFGHTEDNAQFFAQMDHLTPELLRVLRPGRIAAIHVKDRVEFGSVTGTGMATIDPQGRVATAPSTGGTPNANRFYPLAFRLSPAAVDGLLERGTLLRARRARLSGARPRV